MHMLRPLGSALPSRSSLFQSTGEQYLNQSTRTSERSSGHPDLLDTDERLQAVRSPLWFRGSGDTDSACRQSDFSSLISLRDVSPAVGLFSLNGV
jgi:hypothetical protein